MSPGRSCRGRSINAFCRVLKRFWNFRLFACFQSCKSLRSQELVTGLTKMNAFWLLKKIAKLRKTNPSPQINKHLRKMYASVCDFFILSLYKQIWSLHEKKPHVFLLWWPNCSKTCVNMVCLMSCLSPVPRKWWWLECMLSTSVIRVLEIFTIPWLQ